MISCGLGLFAPALIPESITEFTAIAIILVLIIGGFLYLSLDLSLIAITRFLFIFSFFFKADITLFKIDEIEDPSGLNISLTLVTALFLIGYDLIDSNRQCDVRVQTKLFSILVLAIFIWTIISVIYAGSSPLGWFSIWSFLTLIIVTYSIASHFSNRERLIEIVSALAFGLLFTGLVSISQYFADFPTNLAAFGTGTEEELFGTQSQLLSRVPAFMRTPTEMAWVVASLIPIITAILVCRVKDFNGWQKFLVLASVILGIAAIILSLARGSWISLVVGLLMLFSLGWYRLSSPERKNYFISLVGVAVLGCLVLLPLSGRIYDRLNGEDEGSALIRIPLMETAIRMIKDNPIVGVGMNGYRSSMTKYDETDIFVSQVFPNPVHNIFAHITGEIGIPGGILFCLLIFAALFECWKAMTIHDRLLFAIGLGVMVGIIGFVISAIKEPGSLGSTRPPMRTLFLMFGIILAISRIRRQNII